MTSTPIFSIINHIDRLSLYPRDQHQCLNGLSKADSDGHSPPDDDIREQLEKILASPEFQSSPMLRDFLSFVVEQALSGLAQEIKGYTIATEVMGRKPDIDGTKDTIVRIQAGRLRRALERYYLTLGEQDHIRIYIPKGAYVPTFETADKKGMDLNPHYPGWFCIKPYLYFYQQGKYTSALQEAQQFQMPQLFWDPPLRAAALGQLGRKREVAQALAELLRLKPDFSTSGPFLIGCYVKNKDLAGALLDGLRKAGLHI